MSDLNQLNTEIKKLEEHIMYIGQRLDELEKKEGATRAMVIVVTVALMLYLLTSR